MQQIELIPYIPETASYQIWHPREFLVNEDEEGIVTITSPVTGSNLTLSGFQVNQEVTEAILLKFFQEATENYTLLSEIKSKVTSEKIWLEGDFKNEKAFWIWWALSRSNQIILASINSDDILSEKDRHLYTFIIDKMEIYPAEFGD